MSPVVTGLIRREVRAEESGHAFLHACEVLEDVQWADEATLDTIRFLGRRIGLAHGLLVLTYRDGEVDQDHPLRRVIGDIPAEGVVRVRLAPLSAEGVAALLDGTGLDPAEVLALTAGNPLFVTQVAAWGREGVPASVRDIVLARVMRLPATPPRLRRSARVSRD